MTLLRGTQKIAASQVMATSDPSTDYGYVGQATNVLVAVKNETGTATTFKIQVSFPPTTSAGKNVTPGDWFDYNGATGIALAGNSTLAVDLSPFAPQYVRIVNTGSGTTVSAWVHANG